MAKGYSLKAFTAKTASWGKTRTQAPTADGVIKITSGAVLDDSILRTTFPHGTLYFHTGFAWPAVMELHLKAGLGPDMISRSLIIISPTLII
ncbi:MAG: hypothetical protein JWR19_2711 [Pedosphaera sp.]|nr:hypothetical protein [Pedosphaera sp.]